MIKMTMHHGKEIQQRDLPCDFLSLKVSLFQKIVPANVKSYICKDEDAPAAPETPKPRRNGPDEQPPDAS